MEKIIQGDCIEKLKELEENSVDAKTMKKETHLSSCCREPITVKSEGQGLYCSKCGSETFSTIIIEEVR